MNFCLGSLYKDKKVQMSSNQWIYGLIVGVIVILIIILVLMSRREVHQWGGESRSYRELKQEPLGSLGSLSEGVYNPPTSEIPLTHHLLPSRIHPPDQVFSDGRDERVGNLPVSDSIYRDTYHWLPYDWRPFEWRPEARQCARNCTDYATNQCSLTGITDYQSCFDQAFARCEQGNWTPLEEEKICGTGGNKWNQGVCLC